MKRINSDVAYDYIRKRVLSGEYPPGQALMTKKLSDETGVSRTPIRDALRQLEVDGLVTITPRLGASVKTMDFKEFSEMCVLRLALESHAAGLAAQNHTESDLKEIAFALEAMRSLTTQMTVDDKEQSLIPEMMRADVRFHISIITAARNDLMKKEILRLHLVNRIISGDVLSPRSHLVVNEKTAREEDRRKVLASHEEIFQGITNNDAVAAKAAMERHIQDIIDKNLQLMVRAQGGLMAKNLSEAELIYNG